MMRVVIAIIILTLAVIWLAPAIRIASKKLMDTLSQYKDGQKNDE